MDGRLGDRKTTAVSRRSADSKQTSPFVGRDEEVRRLTAALTLAAEGQGGMILLAGQSGIGKTRLARETLALAKGRGFTTLEGHAHPIEAGLAYAPFLDAFRPLLRRLDYARLTTLISDLPSLGRLFEGIRLLAQSFSPVGLSDPALEKTRLFEAVLRLLERLAREAPVILFLDDLHRADPASLDLLYYLARGLSDQRVLLLAAYSSEDSDICSGLRTVAGPLLRDGLAREIIIPRLGPDAVNQLVRAILGGEAPGGLIALLDARAEGTPLYIEGLVFALIDCGQLSPGDTGWVLGSEASTALPPSVRQLILDRLIRLSPPARRVLDLLAVMGDSTPHTMLGAASRLDEETLLETMGRLRVKGLIAEKVDGPDVVYNITHPLIQDVAYAELSEMERRRIHKKAIEALESCPEGRPDYMSRLARHYRGAGPEADPDRALAVTLAAGERARSIYANEEAARHYFAALTMVRSRRQSGGQGSGVKG